MTSTLLTPADTFTKLLIVNVDIDEFFALDAFARGFSVLAHVVKRRVHAVGVTRASGVAFKARRKIRTFLHNTEMAFGGIYRFCG